MPKTTSTDVAAIGMAKSISSVDSGAGGTAVGMVALERIQRLAGWADAVGAWSLEAWDGLEAAMHSSIHRVRNHTGAILSAHNIRAWIAGSARAAQPRSYVQDPYSFRCMPQVHGASRDVLEGVRTVFEAEMNAVTDNPLVFPVSYTHLTLPTKRIV